MTVFNENMLSFRLYRDQNLNLQMGSFIPKMMFINCMDDTNG